MKYITIFHGFRNEKKKKKCSIKLSLLRIQAPRTPIQLLTAISVAWLRKKANHSTNVATKTGFHSEAVEVIIYLIRYKKKNKK